MCLIHNQISTDIYASIYQSLMANKNQNLAEKGESENKCRNIYK